MRYKDMTASRFHLPTEGQHIINDMKRRGVDKRKPKMFAMLLAKVTKMVKDESDGKILPTVDYELSGHPLTDKPEDRTSD